MKKMFSLMLLLATILTFTACSGDDDDEPDMSYLTEQQKAVLPALHGTFTSTLELVGWTTTIEFLEQFHPAKDAFDPSTNSTIPEYIHGKLRITHYEGSSFEYYYRLDNNATRLFMGHDINNWENVNPYDFRFVNENEFKLRDKGATLWDVYSRK